MPSRSQSCSCYKSISDKHLPPSKAKERPTTPEQGSSQHPQGPCRGSRESLASAVVPLGALKFELGQKHLCCSWESGACFGG